MIRFENVAASTALTLVLLTAGCAGGPSSVQSGAVASAVLPQGADSGGLKYRLRSQRCSAGGGTWTFPAFAKQLDASLAYGSSHCAAGSDVMAFSELDDYGWPVPAGYSFVLAFGVDFGKVKLIFQGTGLTGSVSSSLFSPSDSYTLFIYDGSKKLLSQQSLGSPSGQTLQFSSPLQGGFKFAGIHDGQFLSFEIAEATT